MEAAHSLLVLSKHPIDFANTRGQRLRVLNDALYLRTERDGFQQHYQRIDDQEPNMPLPTTSTAFGTTMTARPTQYAGSRPPSTAASSAPPTPQPQHPRPEETIISRTFSLSRGLTQTFCPHISGPDRVSACVKGVCGHFCCRKSHMIWRDHIAGQGPDHLEQSGEARPRAKPAPRRALGRPRKYDYEAPASAPAQEHGSAPAVSSLDTHLPFDMHTDGRFVATSQPEMPSGTMLNGTGYSANPWQFAPQPPYHPRQYTATTAFHTAFRPFAGTMSHPPFQAPLPQGPQYGVLRPTGDSQFFQHALRPMQAEQPVFDLRRQQPHADRIRARNAETEEGCGDKNTMGVGDTTADLDMPEEEALVQRSEARKEGEADDSAVDES